MIDDPNQFAEKRGAFQFSLRSLLIFVALVAMPCGWLAMKAAQAHRQRVAVQAIRDLDGKVWYGDRYDEEPQIAAPNILRRLLTDDFFCTVTSVDSPQAIDELTYLPELKRLRLSHADVTEDELETVEGMRRLHALFLNDTRVNAAGLSHLQKLYELEELNLDGTQLTDDDLAPLEKFTQLKTLHLQNTRITNAGLERLAGLTQIEWLDLGNNDISDDGLQYLSGMTRLRTLGLEKTHITGDGLADLANFDNLKILLLDGTPINDAGLENLAPLNQLHNLHVENTRVTAAGISRLQDELPNCRIYH